MLIIFGWLRRFTVLGIKIDECPQCGRVCEHVVGRKTNWGHIFWLPLLSLGWEHGMACTVCHAWTGIGWREVRAAMRSGELHLDRPRPAAMALLAAEAEQAALSNEPPPHPTVVFDRMLVNPKRGPWDFWTKAWPIVFVAVIAFSGVSAALKPVTASGSRGSQSTGPAIAPSLPAHQCWLGQDGQLNGCTRSNGTVLGSGTGTPITCYFEDAALETSDTLSCDR